MANVNWDEERPDDAPLAPGEYLAEVVAATEKYSQGGDLMFALRFETRGDGAPQHLCYDNLMLQGKGLSIALAKLKAMGFDRVHATIDAKQLIGRRVRLACIIEEYNGRQSLKPDIRADGFKCGYLPVEQGAPVPAAPRATGGAAGAPDAAADGEPAPF